MARGEVRYRLVVDNTGFKKGFAEAEAQVKSLGASLQQNLGPAGDILSKVGAGGFAAAAALGAVTAAATAAGKAVLDAVTSAAKYADNLAALADRTGLSASALQKLDLAAKLGNSSLEAVAGSVNKMQRALVEGSDAFQRLGLSASELRRMAPEEAFRQVSEAILALKSPTDQAAAAMAVFGKSGAEQLGVMKAMASGAADLGGALSDDMVKAAADLQDELDRLSTAWERVILQFGAAIGSSPGLMQALQNVTILVARLADTIAKHEKEFQMFLRVVDAVVTRGAVGALGSLLGAAVNMTGGTGGDIALPPVAPKGGGTFTGAKDWREAEAAAKKAREAWVRAAEDSRKEWDKFDKDLRKFGDQALTEWSKESNKAFEAIATGRGKEAIDALEAAAKKQLEDWGMAAKAAEQAFQKNQEWVASLRDVGAALDQLGDAFGGVLGGLLGLGAAGVQVFANLKDAALQAQTTTQKLAGVIAGAAQAFQSGSLLGGAAAGAAAGAAFGPLGAVIGGVGGAILGLFGGNKKKEEERKKKQQELMDQFASLQQQINSMTMEKLQGGVSGLAALFHNAADAVLLTQERMDRLGVLGAAMFQALREQGLSTVEAMKAMGPALDEAIAAAEKAGLTINGTLGTLAAFREKVLANEGLVNAAEGLSSVMEALRATGTLTQETADALQGELGSIFDELIGKGFTSNEALALLAPTLLQIRDAAADGRIAVDEATQAMINQAEQAGLFEGVTDPMAELLKVQQDMLLTLVAMAEVFGATLPKAVQDYIDKLNKIPNVPAPPGMPDEFKGGPSGGQEEGGFSGQGRIPGFATGGIVTRPTLMFSGGRPVGIAGERGPEAIVPLNGGGLGPQTIVIPISIGGEKLDPVIIRRTKAGMYEVAHG